jgi:hypothetical protein
MAEKLFPRWPPSHCAHRYTHRHTSSVGSGQRRHGGHKESSQACGVKTGQGKDKGGREQLGLKAFL